MAALDASLRSLPGAAGASVSARPDDARLVREAGRGSAAAWDELFTRHWPLAYRAAYLVVHDAAAAEDVCQDAFLAALRALDRFDRRRPFGPWLHRIVVNRAIDHVRAVARRPELTGHAAESAAPDVADRRDEALLAAIAALPVEQRAVVVLRHLLEWTPREIAGALRIPRGTVNSRLRRGLDALAERLREGSR